MTEKSKKLIWTGRGISILATLPFILSAAMKLSKSQEVLIGMNHLGIPETLLPLLATLELLCVVTYLIPQTAVLGAILFTGYCGGTIITHLRLGEGVGIQITLGVLIWLGLYLRDTRLRALLPLRQLLKT